MVRAAGGGAGNPEPLPEPKRAGAVCHPPAQRVDRGAGLGAAATALRFRLSELLQSGGRGSHVWRDPRLDDRPDPWWYNGSRSAGLRR